jgi:hypothetical protein
MSDPVDQIWQWMHEPLQRLKQECRDAPEISWHERLPMFLDSLGVGAVDDHPVLRLLADHVEQLDSSEDQIAFLASDELDTHVYYFVQQTAAPAEPEPAQAAHGQHAEQHEPAAAATTPEEAAEQVLRLIAIPVLTELAASRPDLIGHLSTEELNETLGRALAERLVTA